MGRNYNEQNWVITRRYLLKSSAAMLAGPALMSLSCTPLIVSGHEPSAVRFGIVADSHYADADMKDSRYYRHSLKKMAECVELMNIQKVDFLVELGDFKDQNTPAVEQRTLLYLRAIEEAFCKFNGPTYHVLGNHDLDSLSKTQFLTNIENTGIDTDRNYYSFNFNGIYFVVLDANYKSDGSDYDHGNFDWPDTNVPPAELQWLRQELAAVCQPVIVLIHQPLDGAGSEYVNNAEELRRILEQSGKVVALFQGHRHGGDYNLVQDIHYYTLRAMVEGRGPENNSYAIVEVHPNLSITVIGYRKAVSKKLAPTIIQH